MKDIDFLPVWYRKSRRRSLGYRWQYAVIGTVFAVMVCWSFFTGKLVSTGSAQTDIIQTTAMDGEFIKLKTTLDDLSARQHLIDKCSSNIKISGVFAELSFVIDKNIVLNRIQLVSEEYDKNTNSNTPRTSVVRRAGVEESILDRNIIYKLVLNGIASTSGDVASLICGIEKSDYFCNVIPAYTRSIKVEEHIVTEFEIECYIANYKVEYLTD